MKFESERPSYVKARLGLAVERLARSSAAPPCAPKTPLHSRPRRRSPYPCAHAGIRRGGRGRRFGPSVAQTNVVMMELGSSTFAITLAGGPSRGSSDSLLAGATAATPVGHSPRKGGRPPFPLTSFLPSPFPLSLISTGSRNSPIQYRPFGRCGGHSGRENPRPTRPPTWRFSGCPTETVAERPSCVKLLVVVSGSECWAPSWVVVGGSLGARSAPPVTGLSDRRLTVRPLVGCSARPTFGGWPTCDPGRQRRSSQTPVLGVANVRVH